MKPILPKILEMREGALTHQILDYLSLKYKGRAKFWRNQTGALRSEERFVRFGEVGSPDILGILGPTGRLVAIEVKTSTGKPTPAQTQWLSEATSLGALAGIVHSVEEAIVLLDRGLAEAQALLATHKENP